MIPNAAITAWRKTAPWGEDWQVEQDLFLSRARIDMFRRPTIAEQVAFRGGTALHKLFFNPPGRYSEDIDLVQRNAGPTDQPSLRRTPRESRGVHAAICVLIGSAGRIRTYDQSVNSRSLYH